MKLNIIFTVSQLEHSKHSMDYIELPAETYGNFMGVPEKDK